MPPATLKHCLRSGLLRPEWRFASPMPKTARSRWGKLARCWCAAPRLCKAIGTIRKPVLRRCARWLHTGDIGCQDEFGQLTLKDRSKDTIISGGFNIYPREVEDAALTHPAVAEVSVLGRIH